MNQVHVEQSSGLTRRLAEFASSFTLPLAPTAVLENAKTAILDCLGVSVLAVSQEIGRATLAFARENACEGDCTVWGTALATRPRDAAFCNGVLAHGLDYDDRNHSSTFSLAAAAAVAEQNDLPGTLLLEAFIVGREVRNSLDTLFADRGSGVGPGAKGWHSNGILGSIAAACAAGNALRLDGATMLHAVGLAAGSCGALTRDGGTMAKPFRTGHSAATGLTCALLARSGFSADETALEGRFGLLDALSPIPDAAIRSLGKDLGDRFHLEAPVKVKAFASCTATHSATEAMLRLRRAHPVDPASVDSIECDLKPYPLVRQNPRRGFEGRFSLPFCLAIALIHGRLEPEDFSDRNINDPAVQGLIQRTRHAPGARTLVLALRDGTTHSEPLEAPSNLAGLDAIRAKFHRSADGILTAPTAARVIDLVHDLETLPSLRALTRALRTSAG